ncbi:hypothetical protein HGRIS_004406 [Hohenbuehelia grisea]|uniref:Uncharacterized protein n=1 Tax=Hohenbuehelia grisea TaxID=104357 RepID=A0ABR3JCJ3_9AGAR
MRFSLVILAAFAALAAAAPVADNGMDINNALDASAETEEAFFDNIKKQVKNLSKQVKVPKAPAAGVKSAKTLLKGTTKPKVRLSTKLAAVAGAVANAAAGAVADAAAAAPADEAPAAAPAADAAPEAPAA